MRVRARVCVCVFCVCVCVCVSNCPYLTKTPVISPSQRQNIRCRRQRDRQTSTRVAYPGLSQSEHHTQSEVDPGSQHACHNPATAKLVTTLERMLIHTRLNRMRQTSPHNLIPQTHHSISCSEHDNEHRLVTLGEAKNSNYHQRSAFTAERAKKDCLRTAITKPQLYVYE